MESLLTKEFLEAERKREKEIQEKTKVETLYSRLFCVNFHDNVAYFTFVEFFWRDQNRYFKLIVCNRFYFFLVWYGKRI